MLMFTCLLPYSLGVVNLVLYPGQRSTVHHIDKNVNEIHGQNDKSDNDVSEFVNQEILHDGGAKGTKICNIWGRCSY